MTPQESQALQDFLRQLTQVKGVSKDPQAEDLIARAVSQQPDAAYLLTQRSMLLEQALDHAKAEISRLRNASPAAAAAAPKSFLDPGSAWGHSAVSPGHQPVSSSAPRAMSASAPGPTARPGFLGGGGSFLGSLAATAAGVAGGAFLFHGLQNLLGDDSDAKAETGASSAEAAGSGNDSAAQTDSAAPDNGGSGDADFLDTGDSGDDGLG